MWHQSPLWSRRARYQSRACVVSWVFLPLVASEGRSQRAGTALRRGEKFQGWDCTALQLSRQRKINNQPSPEAIRTGGSGSLAGVHPDSLVPAAVTIPGPAVQMPSRSVMEVSKQRIA